MPGRGAVWRRYSTVPSERVGAVAQRDTHLCGRAVAGRIHQTTGFVDIASHTLDIGIAGEVPHRAVAAGEEDVGVLRGIDLTQRLGVPDGLAERGMAPVARGDGVLQFQTIDGRLTTLDRSKFDRDACVLQFGQWMGDFA